MGSEASLWGDVISAISPEVIYVTSWRWASVVSMFAVLGFLIAPAMRIMTDKLRGAKNSEPVNVRDIFIDVGLAAIGYAMYSVLAYLIFEWVINIQQGVNAFHNNARISEAFAGIMADLDATETDFKMSDISGSVTSSLMYGVWLITNLIYLCIAKAMHYAHAFTFGLLLCTGPLLISLSSWKATNYLAGWGKMWVVILLWPVLEWVAMGLASMSFSGALDQINPANYENTSSLSFKTMLWAVMAILNVLAAALTVSVPMITNSLVSNSGDIAASVGPFSKAGAGAGAGMGAGALVGNATKKGAASAAQVGANAVSRGGNNFGRNALNAVASSESLRNSMPLVDQALTKMGHENPGIARRTAESNLNQSGGLNADGGSPRPGSVAHKFDSLAKTPVMQSASSSRNPTIKDNGSSVDKFGEPEKSSSAVTKLAGSELSLAPMESASTTSNRSGSSSNSDSEKAASSVATAASGSSERLNSEAGSSSTTSAPHERVASNLAQSSKGSGEQLRAESEAPKSAHSGSVDNSNSTSSEASDLAKRGSTAGRLELEPIPGNSTSQNSEPASAADPIGSSNPEKGRQEPTKKGLSAAQVASGIQAVSSGVNSPALPDEGGPELVSNSKEQPKPKSNKSAAARKGVFADKALKASGKRKS